jgi:hypothetical protein
MNALTRHAGSAWVAALLPALLVTPGAARAQTTISNTVTLSRGAQYPVPAGEHLTITWNGELNAPTYWENGASIHIVGRAENEGMLRAGFARDTMGLTVTGSLDNRFLVETMRLVVGGDGAAASVVNREALIVGWHESPPGGGFLEPSQTLAQYGIGLDIAAGAQLRNETGRLINRGSSTVAGVFANSASVVLGNTARMYRGGSGYTQHFDVQPGGRVANLGSMELQPLQAVRIEGTWQNFAGSFTSLESSSATVRAGGALINAGGWVQRGGTLVLDSGGFLRNPGSMSFANWASVWLQADVINAGAMSFEPTTRLSLRDAFLYNEGLVTLGGVVDGLGRRASLVNVGTMVVPFGGWVRSPVVANMKGGTLVVNGRIDADVSFSSGTLLGSGVIQGKVRVFGGNPQAEANCKSAGWTCVKPGNSPGRLTVEGDMSFEAGSLLELEVERAAKGEGLAWDELVVQSLSFTKQTLVRVVLGQGVASPEPVTLPLVHCLGGAGACDYSFASFEVLGGSGGKLVANAGGGLDIVFGGAFGSAVAAVPEPGTWALMALGLGAMSGWARRRARDNAVRLLVCDRGERS